jgi:hypothetical protein
MFRLLEVDAASGSKLEGGKTGPKKGRGSKPGPPVASNTTGRRSQQAVSTAAPLWSFKMVSLREKNSIVKKQLAHRELMWPGCEPQLWHRNAHKGYATIPKTMPLILQIMDDLSGKGKPVSSTYLSLWCETWDNSMVNTSKQQELAYGAGFRGERAIYTWSARVKLLHELKFIDIKPGNSGPISHVLILNPHWIIRWHHHNKTPGMKEGNFNALLSKAVDVGANDMIEALDLSVPASEPVAATSEAVAARA